MANTVLKNAIAKAKIEDQIIELMIKTRVSNIVLDDGVTTLASKLSEIMTSISSLPDTEAVKQLVSTEIDKLVDGADEAMDTLKELGDALNNNKSTLEAIQSAIGDKVAKEDGKGLSANDFTDILKAKLDSIAEGAEVNQNAFSKVKVGEVLIDSTDKTDTVEFVAGDNVKLTADAEGKSIKIDVEAKTVELDDELNESSENGLKNKAIAAALNKKPNVFIQKEEPLDLKTNDIWLQILDDPTE